jgi:hypothetical protein
VLDIAVSLIDTATWKANLTSMVIKVLGAFCQHYVQTVFSVDEGHQNSGRF